MAGDGRPVEDSLGGCVELHRSFRQLGAQGRGEALGDGLAVEGVLGLR
jgi:hypothetical protein